MSYIGNQPFNTAYVVDRFSGNGTTTTFTLSTSAASASGILVVISGVLQDPTTYSALGVTLTFSTAPPLGTNNIVVRYLGLPASNVTTTAYRNVTEVTAVAGQTTFTIGSYTPGFLDVYRNGVKLAATDFTATSGTTVVLNNAASAGDTIHSVSLYVSSVLNAIPATSGVISSNYISNGGITAEKLDVVAGNGTGAVRIPTGTTAQRGVGPGTGALRFNQTSGYLETYNGAAWNSLAVLGDGSSFSSAATSAASIKALTGTTTSGYYWIFLNGNPTQVYCDMSGSTAWMLAMRMNSNDTTFGYTAAYWTNNTGLNDTGNVLTAINIKNGALWGSYPVANIRITGSTNAAAYNSNVLTFNSFGGATLNSIFNSGNATYTGPISIGRTAWLNWANAASGAVVADFNTQPNCNIQGVNVGNSGGGSYCRIGISMNNEADCASNDSWAGIGGSRLGAAGAAAWTPATAYYCHAWLWIN